MNQAFWKLKEHTYPTHRKRNSSKLIYHYQTKHNNNSNINGDLFKKKINADRNDDTITINATHSKGSYSLIQHVIKKNG